MKDQFLGIQEIFSNLTSWQAEVGLLIGGPVDKVTAAERIHFYIGSETGTVPDNPRPRVVVVPTMWRYDFHMGNCKCENSFHCTMELLRVRPDSVAEYEDICLDVAGSIQDILMEFSQYSYGGGSPYAQAIVDLVDGPYHDSVQETDEFVIHPTDRSVSVQNWWMNFTLTTKSS